MVHAHEAKVKERLKIAKSSAQADHNNMRLKSFLLTTDMVKYDAFEFFKCASSA